MLLDAGDAMAREGRERRQQPGGANGRGRQVSGSLGEAGAERDIKSSLGRQ